VNTRAPRRPDAGQELQRAERGDAVLRIVRPAQHREQVFDVGGLEELEAAVFHVRNVAPHQLELEQIGMVRGAEQHRLVPEQHAALARLQHPRHHVSRLALVVRNRDVARLRARLFLRVQALADERVGGIEHRLRRAIVLLQRHRGRAELRFETADVLHGGGAERVDRLRIVADHGQTLARGLEALQDLRLQHVGVLVFVDQHVLEARADLGRERVVLHHRVPVEQQVVVVEALIAQFSFHVIPEQPRQFCFPFRTPRKHQCQRLGERPLRVDAMRVDGEAGVLAREALLGLGQAALVAHHVHEIRRIAAVEHAEALRKAEPLTVESYQPVGHRVEGARPRQAYFLLHLRDDAARAPRHLERRAAREGEEQQPLGRAALQDQVRDAVRERVGLAGARTGDDQQRCITCARGFALPRVELVERVEGPHGRRL